MSISKESPKECVSTCLEAKENIPAVVCIVAEGFECSCELNQTGIDTLDTGYATCIFSTGKNQIVIDR